MQANPPQNDAPPPAPSHDGADNDDDQSNLGDIPGQITMSLDSDTVHMHIEPQRHQQVTPGEDRTLFSPAFDGDEVTFSLSNPPVPAALRAAAGCSTAAPSALRPAAE